MSEYETIPFADTTVMFARKIILQLKCKRLLIKLPDILIAATALEKGLPLATLNQRHFERIEGLELITLN